MSIINVNSKLFRYPTAIEAIKDKELWNDMKRRCDEIGYCGFTPEV